MVSVAKVITSKGASEVVEKAGELIKSKDKNKLKKAEDLLTKEKKKIKIDKQEVDVSKDGKTTTIVDVDKKAFKVKKPTEISDFEAQDLLLKYNANKLTPKVLSDFNVKNLKSEKDILNFIEIISKKYSKEIKNRKRNIQEHEQTKKLATLIGKDSKNLTKTLLNLRPGDTLNAEYMLAARELLAAGMGRLDDLAAVLTKDGGVNATDVLRLEFRQHFALMSELQKIIKGVQTETARTLNAMKIPTRTKQFTNVNIDDLNKSDLIIQMGGSDSIDNLAVLYLRSGSDQAKLKFTQDTGGFLNLKKVSDSIGEIFINSILSAPMTHVRNTAGNWIAQGVIATERKLAARITNNPLLRKTLGYAEDHGIAAYEDVAHAYGISMANQEMFVALSKTFKEKGGLMKIIKNYENLFPATHGGSKVEMHGQKLSAENFNIENKAAAKGIDLLGQILTLDRIPTKMLHVGDNFFKNRQYRAALFTQAYREAMENYHKGSLQYDDLSAFIASRVDRPTKNMVELAKKEMSYSVFQTKAGDRGDALGHLAKIAQRLKGSGGGYMSWLTNYYIPFTQTPINITGFVAERTPGLAHILTGYKNKIAAGGVEATMARMKLQLGTAFYLASISSTYALKDKGQRSDLMTLSGADNDVPGKFDGGKYTMLEGFGFQPNSIRIPDGKGGYHQFNLTGNDPISSMFAMAGNTSKYIESVIHDGGYDVFLESSSNFHPKFGNVNNTTPSIYDSALMTFGLILSFGENLTNSTYLAGAGNFFNDVQNASVMMSGDVSKETMSKITNNWSMKFSSAFIPNIVKKTSKTFINSDYKKINNEWSTLIESQLFNKNLPTKYNIFGKPIETFGFYSNIKLNDAQKEVYRVMPKLSRTTKSINVGKSSVLMTAKEQQFFQYHSGNMFNKKVETLIASPEYQNLDVALKKIAIQNTLKEARSDAKIMLRSDGDVNNNKNKLSDGSIAPISNFYEDLNIRSNELLLEKLKQQNDGDPFINSDLIDFENTINQQKEIIEANTQ